MDAQRALAGHTGLRRILIALVTIIAVFAAAAFGLKQTPSAAAEEDSNFTVGEPTVERSVEGEKQTLKAVFPWEAKNDFEAGDSFEVVFPDNFPPSNDQFDLVASDGTVGGHCVANGSQKTVTCTLNDNFVGRNNVKGTVKVEFTADKVDGETIDFNIDDGEDRTATVKLPPNTKASEPGVNWSERDYEPRKNFTKEGYIVDRSASPIQLVWRIFIPHEELANASKVEIDDQLTGDHKFDGRVFAFHPQNAAMNPYDEANVKHNADINVTGKNATITVTPNGQWSPNEDLLIVYYTERTSDKPVQEGETFGNKASAFGKEDDAKAVFTTRGSGTIQGDENQGNDLAEFHIRKDVVSAKGKDDKPKLNDEELGSVREQLDGKKYPVTVKLKFPEGTSQDILNGIEIDGKSGVIQVDENREATVKQDVEFKVETEALIKSAPEGDMSKYGVAFSNIPVGTEVTISEDTNKPALKGYKYGTENFIVHNPEKDETTEGKTASFKIDGPHCVKIKLDNPVEVEKDRSGLWWLLLLLPIIPGLAWLSGQIPGMSSNPSAPTPGQPGDQPKPGDNPQPGQPGDRPEPQQPGSPEQPVKPGAPGEGRQPIQSVPSGATEKGNGVADFIG